MGIVEQYLKGFLPHDVSSSWFRCYCRLKPGKDKVAVIVHIKFVQVIFVSSIGTKSAIYFESPTLSSRRVVIINFDLFLELILKTMIFDLSSLTIAE